MKKILSLIISAFVVGTFFGCASSKVAINEYESIAVIGVTGNKNLSEQVDSTLARSGDEDSDDTSLLSSLVDKIFHGDSPELLTAQDRVDYAEEYFRHALEDIAGLNVATKEQVVESDEYKNSIKNILGLMDIWISATDFDKNLYSIGSKKARIIMKELGVNSLVAAEFRFNKVLADESKVKTTVRAQVIMDVILYDSRGRKSVINQYEAISQESLPVRKFKYDEEALVELYPPIIENVINKFIVDNIQ